MAPSPIDCVIGDGWNARDQRYICISFFLSRKWTRWQIMHGTTYCLITCLTMFIAAPNLGVLVANVTLIVISEIGMLLAMWSHVYQTATRRPDSLARYTVGLHLYRLSSSGTVSAYELTHASPLIRASAI